jgi:hypothetical protein
MPPGFLPLRHAAELYVIVFAPAGRLRHAMGCGRRADFTRLPHSAGLI